MITSLLHRTGSAVDEYVYVGNFMAIRVTALSIDLPKALNIYCRTPIAVNIINFIAINVVLHMILLQDIYTLGGRIMCATL